MPLKHHIETRLIALLGAAIVATGVFLAFVRPIAGGLYFGIALVLAILYPIFLYPLFKRDRADKVFRLLHWFPAGLLFLALVIDVVAEYWGGAELLHAALRWSWGIIPVIVGVGALAWFCIDVIRRRTARLWILAILFVPYAYFGLSAQHAGPGLTAFVGSGSGFLAGMFHSGSGAEIRASQTASSARSLEPSDDPSEERWRASLRAVDTRGMEVGTGKGPSVAKRPELPGEPQLRPLQKKPNHLPHSGLGIDLLLLSMIGGYASVLHDRARRRNTVESR